MTGFPNIYSREMKPSFDQAVILYYRYNTSADGRNVQDKSVYIIENDFVSLG